MSAEGKIPAVERRYLITWVMTSEKTLPTQGFWLVTADTSSLRLSLVTTPVLLLAAPSFTMADVSAEKGGREPTMEELMAELESEDGMDAFDRMLDKAAR